MLNGSAFKLHYNKNIFLKMNILLAEAIFIN